MCLWDLLCVMGNCRVRKVLVGEVTKAGRHSRLGTRVVAALGRGEYSHFT